MTSAWPAAELESRKTRIGSTTFPLILHERLWIHRRVETIELLDEGKVRRTMSVDFTLPSFTRDRLEIGGAGQVCVPLALLRKRPLRNFDLFDEDRTTLPTLTKSQNGVIATAMLVAAARATARIDPTEDVTHDLRTIAEGNPAEARVARDGFHLPRGTAGDGQRMAIQDVPRMGMVMSDLVASFVMFAVVDCEASERRVLKYAFDETFHPQERTWQQRIGWRSAPLTLLTPVVGRSESYHAEVIVPEDLVASKARLAEAGAEPLARDANSDRPSLYTSHAHRDTRGTIYLDLRIPHTGFLAAAATIAGLSSALLIVGAAVHDHLGQETETTAAILAGLLGFFAGYAVRPGEHPLVKAIFTGTRLLMLGSGLLSFVAAMTLIAGLRGTGLMWTWIGLALVSGIVTASIGWAWFSSRQDSTATPDGDA